MAAYCDCENQSHKQFFVDMQYAMSAKGIAQLKTIGNYSSLFLGSSGISGVGRAKRYAQCMQAVRDNPTYRSVPDGDFTRFKNLEGEHSAIYDTFYKTKFKPFVQQQLKSGALK